MAEVAIRSNWWPSAHGQTPWTPHSFLAAKAGAGLDIASDGATKAALAQVLDKLLFEDIADLKRMGRLDSSRLHHLVLDDSVRTLLDWMNDPDAVRASLEGAQWQALVASCKSVYGISPDKDGALPAASKLGGRTGEWGTVWQRFAENPSRYPNLPALLDQARPSVVPLFGDMDRTPTRGPRGTAMRRTPSGPRLMHWVLIPTRVVAFRNSLPRTRRAKKTSGSLSARHLLRRPSATSPNWQTASRPLRQQQTSRLRLPGTATKAT